MTDVDFAILRPRESPSSTKYTSNHNKDLLQLSFGPKKHNKETFVDKEDDYDDSIASNYKSTLALSYNFESECHIAAKLQSLMATVKEKDSFLIQYRRIGTQ